MTSNFPETKTNRGLKLLLCALSKCTKLIKNYIRFKCYKLLDLANYVAESKIEQDILFFIFQRYSIGSS